MTATQSVPRREIVSDWLLVSQERIDAFAAATDDRQWLHVDVERAKRDSPYGGTIAHGFLTLSLISLMLRETVRFEGARMAVNYGLNRVRFVAPVPAGSRIRGRFRAVTTEETADRALKVTWAVMIEREGEAAPCCVAEWITLYFR